MENTKTKKLKLILDNAKPVISKTEMSTNFAYGFRPEIVIIPTGRKDEITFDNIDDAINTIKSVEHITNMKTSEMRLDLSNKCSDAGISTDKEFTVIFHTT